MVKMKFIGNLGGIEHVVEVENYDAEKRLYSVTLNEQQFFVDACAMPSEIVTALIDNKSFDIDLDRESEVVDNLNGKMAVGVRGRVVRLEMLDERRMKMKESQASRFSHSGSLDICSPMPGKILRFLVEEGQKVSQGQGLAVVEAMKMENELQSPKDGVVKELIAKISNPVQGGTILLIIE